MKYGTKKCFLSKFEFPAYTCGVSRAAVSDWAKVVESQGIKVLKGKKARGVEAKLGQQQKQRLRNILDQGALRHGFSTDRWALERIRRVTQEKFKTSYHPKYLSRLLQQLGFSPQKPMPQAIEKEKELVQAWMQKDWTRIKNRSGSTQRSYFGMNLVTPFKKVWQRPGHVLENALWFEE